MLDQLTPCVLARFWRRVDVRGPDECWLWTGCTVSTPVPGRGGYGFFTVNKQNKNRLTHRVAWVATNGDIPQETPCVLHSCDDRYAAGDISYRRCCNPAHLWLGTPKDNALDRERKHRGSYR